jgi:hypothetical protein
MTLYGIEFRGRIRYVGVTKQRPGLRMSEHWKAVKNGSRYPLHNAMRKYGRAECHMVWLATTERYRDLLEAEIAAIRSYGTRAEKGADGLNLTDGGEGTVGFIQPQHVRDAVAESNRRRRGRPIHSEEFKLAVGRRARGNKYCLGRKHSPEFKAAMSARLKGNQFWLGRKHSEATKAKMRASALRHLEIIETAPGP